MGTLSQARLPLEAGRPRTTLPPGACDAHVHVFGGPGEYPPDPERAEDPAGGDLQAWCDRLRARMATLGLARAVLVHSVIYREDCTVTVAALKALGPDFRGVALVRPDVSDAELDALDAVGFRGVRLDLVFPGALTLADAPALLPRLAARGWHVQVFGKWADHAEVIRKLAQDAPCPVVLDHLAYGSESPTFDDLRAVYGMHNLWIKLSSLYRQNAEDIAQAITALAAENPERLIWGSNWPHVRWDGPMPGEAALVDQVADCLNAADRTRIFSSNAARLYGFAD